MNFKVRMVLALASLGIWGAFAVETAQIALAGRGIPYQTLLVNEINHPNPFGLSLFADALMDLFRGKLL